MQIHLSNDSIRRTLFIFWYLPVVYKGGFWHILLKITPEPVFPLTSAKNPSSISNKKSSKRNQKVFPLTWAKHLHPSHALSKTDVTRPKVTSRKRDGVFSRHLVYERSHVCIHDLLYRPRYLVHSGWCSGDVADLVSILRNCQAKLSLTHKQNKQN